MPPAEVAERLFSQFPVEVQQLADNLGLDVRTFTKREARYLAGIKTLEAFKAWCRPRPEFREIMRSLFRSRPKQKSI